MSCKKILTWKVINKGGCHCGGNKMSPTNPTVWEKFKILVIPWMI
jgi:hypothetical protein